MTLTLLHPQAVTPSARAEVGRYLELDLAEIDRAVIKVASKERVVVTFDPITTDDLQRIFGLSHATADFEIATRPLALIVKGNAALNLRSAELQCGAAKVLSLTRQSPASDQYVATLEAITPWLTRRTRQVVLSAPRHAAIDLSRILMSNREVTVDFKGGKIMSWSDEDIRACEVFDVYGDAPQR